MIVGTVGIKEKGLKRGREVLLPSLQGPYNSHKDLHFCDSVSSQSSSRKDKAWLLALLEICISHRETV